MFFLSCRTRFLGRCCMRSRVLETVRCPSVCPFFCPVGPLQQRAVGLLLWARRVGDIDRLLHGRGCSTARILLLGTWRAMLPLGARFLLGMDHSRSSTGLPPEDPRSHNYLMLS